MPAPAKSTPKISMDWWTVIVSVGAALLVRLGIVPHIPW